MAHDVALVFFVTCMISTARAASIREKVALPEQESAPTDDSQVRSLKRKARAFLGFVDSSISPISRLQKVPDSRLHAVPLQKMRGNPTSPQKPPRFQGLPSLPSLFSDTYLPNPFKPEFLDHIRKPWAPNRLEGQKEAPFWHGIYVVLPGGAPNGTGRYWCWSFVWPPRRAKPAKPPVSKPPGGTTPKPNGSSRAPTKVTESEVTPSPPFTPSPEMDASEPHAPENPPGHSTPPTTEEETLIPRSGTPLTTQMPGVTDVPSSDRETTSGQEIEDSGPHTTPFSSHPKTTSGREIENSGPHTPPFSTSEIATTTELLLTTTSWSDATEGQDGTTQQTSAIPDIEASDTDATTASVDPELNEVRPSVNLGPSGVLVNGGVGVETRNYTVRYPGVIKDN